MPSDTSGRTNTRQMGPDEWQQDQIADGLAWAKAFVKIELIIPRVSIRFSCQPLNQGDVHPSQFLYQRYKNSFVYVYLGKLGLSAGSIYSRVYTNPLQYGLSQTLDGFMPRTVSDRLRKRKIKHVKPVAVVATV